jgi:osmotically-inducible protein OsmY
VRAWSDAEIRTGVEEERCCAGGGTADSAIAQQVEAALRRELPLCWQQIRPVVRDGSVTLEGRVEWIHQRAEAESIAHGVRGVVSVVNSIALTGRL